MMKFDVFNSLILIYDFHKTLLQKMQTTYCYIIVSLQLFKVILHWDVFLPFNCKHMDSASLADFIGTPIFLKLKLKNINFQHFVKSCI